MRIYPLILSSNSHNHSLNNNNNHNTNNSNSSSTNINHSSSNTIWQCISTTISKCSSIIQPTSLLIIWSRLNFPRKNHRI